VFTVTIFLIIKPIHRFAKAAAHCVHCTFYQPDHPDGSRKKGSIINPSVNTENMQDENQPKEMPTSYKRSSKTWSHIKWILLDQNCPTKPRN